MKRIIDYFLLDWKKSSNRKPLILRGARQVGKTFAVRNLGKSFSYFVEFNFERDSRVRAVFEQSVEPERIITQLRALTPIPIIPGQTLLFLDEIQQTPDAITALRYFYEQYPDLHVIAAGSLLEFAIEHVGVPVGRVTFRYLYPMSFLEFLVAQGYKHLVKLLLEHDGDQKHAQALDIVHKSLLELVGQYMVLGGMPAVIKQWIETKNPRATQSEQSDLLNAYRLDFADYAKQHQLKYLEILFKKSLQQLSKPFIYARIGEYQKRDLEPALQLLEKAGLVHKVFRSAAQGIPLGAQANTDKFKLVFFDVGLTQIQLGLSTADWLIEPLKAFVNQGELVESFVGQELLAYADPSSHHMLFYWQREQRGSEAEVDYVLELNQQVIPIEVKAGLSNRTKSMHIFLDEHPQSPYGIRFSSHFYSMSPTLKSYPLYAVAKPLYDADSLLAAALDWLIKE